MTNHLAHPKYRPDIDGLRGIAILAVVWYHAFPSALRSGFIGVDIFFVISGFLISSIIFSNLEHNTFSYIEFYNRRIRRIFPALLTVMVASFLFGWMALTADEFKELGKHIAGGAGFITNFILWSESGYFDAAAETKPMLHLWSLAIEEQFYIFWPILLGFTWRRNWSFLRTTTLIAILSFATSIILIQQDATGAFYSPLARFWELMVGGLLAYISLHKRGLISRHTNLQSMFGFVLLVIGLVVINRQMQFPGFWALLPVFGTFFMISAGPSAWLNQHLLSSKFLIWVGLVSYPFYLWHWPLLSFARIIESQKPPLVVNAFMLIVALALAWLTYKYIERPMRFSLSYARLKLIGLVTGIVLIGAASFAVYINNGMEFRKAAPQLNITNQGDISHDIYMKYLHDNFYPCTPLKAREIKMNALENQCFHSKNSGNTDIAIVGDSHSQQLFTGLATIAKDQNIANYIKSGAPTIDNEKFKGIYETLIHSPSIKSVIISAYWGIRVPANSDIQQFEDAFKRTVDTLVSANKSVYIADDVPNFSFDPQKCKYEGRLGLRNQCSESSEKFRSEQKRMQRIIKEIANRSAQVHLLNLSDYFCDSEQCSMAKDGLLFYRDRNHLNLNGSHYIGKRIVKEFPGILTETEKSVPR